MKNNLIEDYKTACDFPGQIDDAKVEESLRKYLAALGVKRQVRKLSAGWTLATEPSLSANIGTILADFEKRSPRDARDALAARDASAARAARAARDALAARAARAASAASDALDASDARDARAARDASAASAARDASDARAALAARAASDALDARAALAARAASDALAARAALAASDARAARDALDASAALAALAASDARAALDASDARAARDASDASAALDARAARDASDARAALAARAIDIFPRRFAAWCIYRGTWWWWHAELSWLATTHLGAVQLKKSSVTPWSRHVYDAYLAGAWLLYWTEDTLFWIPKPTVKTEMFNGRKRLHCEDGPTLECTVENIYFWHGVMVPAFVVTRPEWITIKHIETETNSEVRRIMIERYGQAKYLVDSGAEQIHTDDYGTLYRKEIPGDEPLVMVKVVNSTAEPDGTYKDYFLRVPPTIQTARGAVAWTFGKEEKDYAPAIET